MSDYYDQFIIEKLKKDIHEHFKNMSCKDITLDIDDYFKTYELNLETIHEKYDIKEYSNNIYRDRDLYKHRTNCCIARVWNCGMGGQCSRQGIYNGYCKIHSEKGGENWWLGNIHERRPHNPINHNGKVHEWLC
jgi:hypothetical protein